MEGEKYTSNVNRTLSDFNPQLKFDLKKYQNLPSSLQQAADDNSGFSYKISDEEAQKLGYDWE